jgi:Tfp pilus assembly protein FimT
MKRKQSGVSLSGLLISAVLVAMLALLGMKVVPEVIEYFQIVSAVKAISKDDSARGSVTEVRKAFDRRANIDNISSIKGQDLEVTKDGGQVVVSFAYEKRIPLFSNVSLLIDFQGSSSGG